MKKTIFWLPLGIVLCLWIGCHFIMVSGEAVGKYGRIEIAVSYWHLAGTLSLYDKSTRSFRKVVPKLSFKSERYLLELIEGGYKRHNPKLIRTLVGFGPRFTEINDAYTRDKNFSFDIPIYLLVLLVAVLLFGYIRFLHQGE